MAIGVAIRVAIGVAIRVAIGVAIFFKMAGRHRVCSKNGGLSNWILMNVIYSRLKIKYYSHSAWPFGSQARRVV